MTMDAAGVWRDSMKNRRYILRLRSGTTLRALAHGIEDHLTYEEGMCCIVMRTESGAYIVQAQSRHEEIACWAGLGRRLSVRLIPVRQDRVHVDLIPGRETEKHILLTAGLFFAWGIALPPVCGLIRQRLLIRRVDRLIRVYRQ